mmetsp:Transcript_40440/g.86251  ORF Transcript_40440/g.86251 Transcript_40440/m.86251 type:complete len:229 (+) Transcript_40440:222-908(+)
MAEEIDPQVLRLDVVSAGVLLQVVIHRDTCVAVIFTAAMVGVQLLGKPGCVALWRAPPSDPRIVPVAPCAKAKNGEPIAEAQGNKDRDRACGQRLLLARLRHMHARDLGQVAPHLVEREHVQPRADPRPRVAWAFVGWYHPWDAPPAIVHIVEWLAVYHADRFWRVGGLLDARTHECARDAHRRAPADVHLAHSRATSRIPLVFRRRRLVEAQHCVGSVDRIALCTAQ